VSLASVEKSVTGYFAGLEGIYKESPYCEKQNYTYRPRCQD
jgi:hypothetical protein